MKRNATLGISILLCIGMLMGIAACGTSQPAATTTAAATEAATTTAAATEAATTVAATTTTAAETTTTAAETTTTTVAETTTTTTVAETTTTTATEAPTEPPGPAPKSIKLSIYTARDEAVYEYVIDKFAIDYPEYDVEVTAMGAQEILERVRAESANPQCDFWWGGTQAAFMMATKEGLLEPYTLSVDANIPADYKDPNNNWYGEILLPEVIMYNTDALTPEEAPQDWDDLLDPKWEDSIIIRGVLPSGTMRTIYCAMIIKEDATDPEKGFEWLAKLDKNTKTYSENPTAMYLSITRQEGLLSLWNMQDILIQANTNDQPFGYIIPESGAPILVDGVGIVKNAKQIEGAQIFMEYLYREDIRVGLAEDTFQIPAMTGFDKDKMPQWMGDIELKPLTIDWELLAENEMIWMEYWDQNIKSNN